MLKKSLMCITFFSICFFADAQNNKTVYHDAKQFTLIGKAAQTINYYHRVDTASYPKLPLQSRKLLTNSSGLIVAFKTNSKKISCKWTLSTYRNGNNMTPIVNSGLDLYALRDNRWQYVGVGRPSGIKSEFTIVEHMTNNEKEFLLYLPLYNTIEDLEIGIDADATIHSITNPFNQTVVIYGSSITQGASASRPGLSYTSIIGRDLNLEIFNLGLSGYGLMEREAAHMIADIEADMYILDCASNPSSKIIEERTEYMVKHIREKHPLKPIIMIGRTISPKGNFNQETQNSQAAKNKSFYSEYQKLINAGVKHLYLIKGENLLGDDNEGATDGVHPNDIGFSRMVEIIKPQIEILLSNKKKH